MQTLVVTDYTNLAPLKRCGRTDRRTDRQTDGRTGGRSGPTTRPAFAKATQVNIVKMGCQVLSNNVPQNVSHARSITITHLLHNRLTISSFLYNNMCTFNTISSYIDHFEIQKKGFRRKSIDLCKSVSQRLTISVPLWFWRSGEDDYLFSGTWGALVIILGELGNKLIALVI